jgi:hypothetical protein
MWFDLSPLRPDEYMRMDARLWTEAVVLRNAANEGLQDAHSEGKAVTKLSSLDVGQAG